MHETDIPTLIGGELQQPVYIAKASLIQQSCFDRQRRHIENNKSTICRNLFDNILEALVPLLVASAKRTNTKIVTS
mgnify:CR=1 FL=1